MALTSVATKEADKLRKESIITKPRSKSPEPKHPQPLKPTRNSNV